MAESKSNKGSNWRRLVALLWHSIKSRMQLEHDTDYDATVETIAKGSEFRGFNIWILFFAIIIASVGLNVNSTAVIIGAMLISPLMGPITGIGLAIGTYDEDFLQKSLKNLIVMVTISLVASTIYFLISPISDARSELLARTQPTIFDVLIAFFGGLTGIVATSRKSQPGGVIAGVAIATALMPPLCTAGYGIATLQIWYFLGAFYLFFINSFFIALATFIMVRFLRFPQKTYLDAKRQRKVKQIISIFTIIVLIPSIYLAFDVVKEATFNTQSTKFVNDLKKSDAFKNVEIIQADREYHHRNQYIKLALIGRPLSTNEITQLQDRVKTEYGLTKTQLTVRQANTAIDFSSQNELIGDILKKKDETIAQKDSIITQLRSRLNKAQTAETLSLQLAKEIKTQYPDVKTFAITDLVKYDTRTLENSTIAIIYLEWRNGNHDNEEQQLIEWLKVRIGVTDIKIATLR